LHSWRFKPKNRKSEEPGPHKVPGSAPAVNWETIVATAESEEAILAKLREKGFTDETAREALDRISDRTGTVEEILTRILNSRCFTPSRDYQVIPEGVRLLDPYDGCEYRTGPDKGLLEVRWDDPPSPEKGVIYEEGYDPQAKKSKERRAAEDLDERRRTTEQMRSDGAASTAGKEKMQTDADVKHAEDEKVKERSREAKAAAQAAWDAKDAKDEEVRRKKREEALRDGVPPPGPERKKSWSGASRASQRRKSGPNSQSGSNSPPHFAQGHPISWYATQPINHHYTLLGGRYLCRTGGMMVIAPSGLGKSTLSIQMGILFSCGKPAFGIIPARPLRILIVQSEDDQGDCTEMSQMIDHLGLTDNQKKQVENNTELLRCNDLVSLDFILALDSKLSQAKAQGTPFDLVIANPYSVYLGASTTDTEACIEFLNEWLNPILSKYGVAIIFIHHTPKTNFQSTDQYKIWDWMYWGAGCAGITNWARAILVVKPVSDDMRVYRFIAAKRGIRIGWGDHDLDRYFAWSSVPGVLRWEDASAAQIAAATAQAYKNKAADLTKALNQVPIVDPELKETVIGKISHACNVGERKARNALEQLIFDQKVMDVLIPNPGKGRSFAGVVQNHKNPASP
jgi:hypothetical protein